VQFKEIVYCTCVFWLQWVRLRSFQYHSATGRLSWWLHGSFTHTEFLLDWRYVF